MAKLPITGDCIVNAGGRVFIVLRMRRWPDTVATCGLSSYRHKHGAAYTLYDGSDNIVSGIAPDWRETFMIVSMIEEQDGEEG